jgi:hypothetical protein
MKYFILLILATMTTIEKQPDLDSLAEKYVRLALSVGQQDADYVDAYYGPPEWKEQAKTSNRSLEQIRKDGQDTLKQILSIPQPPDGMESLRYAYLKRQLESLIAFVDLKLGKKFSFDEESRALYDAEAPHLSEEHFAKILQEFETALPGKGTVQERYDAFRKDFIIPPAKLDHVFQLALAESRKRTMKHMSLPPGESFTVEYVTKKPWSGYNWYQGNYRSVIQINTDLPIYIDRAMDLAGHEGYPGHHVYNVMLEQELLRKRKWMEFSIYALFSPQSLIAEGSANYGVTILFPGKERAEFEQSVLFPASGIDRSRVAEYYKLQELAKKLDYAGNEAARHYLNGKWTEDQAVQWLMKYALYTKDRAKQRFNFIRKYRSYVINYNWGEDLVGKYIERRADSPEDRWKELAQLLGSPRLPSGLQ